MDGLSVFDYETPIYRVLLEPNVFMGIGLTPFVIIALITVILMFEVSMYCVIAGVVLVLIAKLLCKKDPQLLQILFDRLAVPDLWRAD